MITGKLKKKYLTFDQGAQQVNRYLIKLVLYPFFGFAIFLVYGFSVYTLIACFIGVLCAFLFYLGTYFSRKSTLFTYLFSIVIPLSFILLANIDFTEKKQWKEMRTDSSFSASFQYFNGEHEIALTLTEGQSIILSREFVNKNGGGHGFHVKDEHDNLVGMTEIDDHTLKLDVAKSGVYRLVFTGDRIKGSFKVKWEIDEFS
ncbi:energy-coupling factor transporter transmembrane protein EcfT [Metabacillus crassostreae]|uniref:hypothetical protein n=1 Tax=Metabacillus crassostreae TaxID=929098 RepID=UPI001959E7BA|nr:hypothetical protein [Metabacillus crassostreae]MBM7602337.1 energy-coupling factor transporter transmembrane protein EcfT [Metabacillus crassostreae]